MAKMNKLDSWHKTAVGLTVFAVIEFGLAYGFVSLAINSGNLWTYLLALVFLVGFLQNFFRLLAKPAQLKTTRKRAKRG